MANFKDLIVNGSARIIGKLFAQTPASNTNNNEVATTSFVCNVGDNKSISKSSNNKLQAIGVLDAQNTANALKTWTGTRAQYDAIATKDNNTIYHITDDTDITLSLLETLYPVGAIYIGTCASCPLQVLGVGNWTLKSDNFITRELVEKKEATVGDPTWYNLYSDGWCEQGGQYIINTNNTTAWYTVTLLKSYTSTQYTLLGTCTSPDARYGGDQWTCVRNKTVSQFEVMTADDDTFNNGTIDWQASGYTSTTVSIPTYKKWERIS